MDGDLRISAVFSLIDKIDDTPKTNDVSTDELGLTSELPNANSATESAESSTDSADSDCGGSDGSPPILTPVNSNLFSSKKCPRTVDHSSPPVLELEETKTDVTFNSPVLPTEDLQKKVIDKTQKSRRKCRKIAPSYIVLRRIDKYLKNGSSTSARHVKRRFSDCTNMCKKMQFIRRLKSGKDVFNVKTPSKFPKSGLEFDKAEDRTIVKIKKGNIKQERVISGHHMKRVNRTISKLPNDFRSWQTFMKTFIPSDAELNHADKDRSYLKKHVCDAFLLRKQIQIKRAHNKKLKLLKLKSKADVETVGTLKSEVKSNVSGRVCKPNTKYLSDFLLNRNELKEQMYVSDTNNQLKRLVNQSNILKEKGMGLPNDKRSFSRKRKSTPDIVLENLEGKRVTPTHTSSDNLRKKFKESLATQVTDIHAQRQTHQQKKRVSNSSSSDGVIIQEMPTEQSVIAELLQTKPLVAVTSDNSNNTVSKEITHTPTTSSSSTSKEHVAPQVVKVAKPIKPKLSGQMIAAYRPEVGLNSFTSTAKKPQNLGGNTLMITLPSSHTSSHVVTNQYGVTYLFHPESTAGNKPVIKYAPVVTSSSSDIATQRDTQTNYSNLKSLVSPPVSFMNQSTYKTPQSVINQVKTLPVKVEELGLRSSYHTNTSVGLKTGLSNSKLLYTPVQMTNTNYNSSTISPNIRTALQSMTPSTANGSKVPTTQSLLQGMSILPQSMIPNAPNGTSESVNKSTHTSASVASSQIPLIVTSNDALSIPSSSANPNVITGYSKTVIPSSGKFYLLKINGKNVLIPTDQINLQPNTFATSDTTSEDTRQKTTAVVNSSKPVLSAQTESKPKLAVEPTYKMTLPQTTPPPLPLPIKIKQEPMDDWSEHLLNSTNSTYNTTPTSTKEIQPSLNMINVNRPFGAAVNETCSKNVGKVYQGRVLVLNNNNKVTIGTTYNNQKAKQTAPNCENTEVTSSSMITKTSEIANVTHSAISKEVKPVPFTEALSAREEKLRKLKELLKEKQKAVEAIRNSRQNTEEFKD